MRLEVLGPRRFRVDGLRDRGRRPGDGGELAVAVDGGRGGFGVTVAGRTVTVFDGAEAHGLPGARPARRRGRARRPAADDVRAPMPGLVKALAAAPGAAVRAGRRAGGARGDEDGARADRAARRRRRRGARRGRGAGRRRRAAAGAGAARMADRVTIYEVEPARRAAERGAADPDARQDRPRRPADRLRLQPHRGGELRQPEVGAADGGRGGGARAASPGAPGVTYAALTPNLKGYAAARAARRARSRSSPRPRRRFSQRNINARSPRAWRDSRRSRRRRARRDAAPRLRLLRDRLPLSRARSRRRRSPRRSKRCSRSAAARSASARPSATARRSRWRAMLAGGARRGAAGAARRAFPRHPRAGAGERRGRRSTGAAGVRRVVRRPRRLPLRAGRGGERRDRGGGWRGSRRWASRPASTPGGWPRRRRSHAVCGARLIGVGGFPPTPRCGRVLRASM